MLTTAAGGYIGVGGYTSEQVDRDITDGLAYGARRPRRVDSIPDRPIADGTARAVDRDAAAERSSSAPP